MEKVRIGVVGAYRGTSMIRYSAEAKNAEVVAICDKREDLLKNHAANYPDKDITYYTNFDEFINHDMDAVVLANYANEHAPFAIRCMKAGKHVFSEVLPVQTLKEAVELIECVEETGMIYAYGENYCYMPAPYEMRRLYREGVLGEFEYGEGEYVHNCEPIWPGITYGDPDHWRNNMYANFYCTHSIGPLIHITGLRPVSVVGFEGIRTERDIRCGAKKAGLGMEVITLENGGIIKSIHGDLYKNSIWYSVYGGKGRAESAREDAECEGVKTIYVNVDEFSGQYDGKHLETYKPKMECDGEENNFGHGGSDFYTMYNFTEKILGNPKADIIDVYEAMDMFLPGMFAYRSVMQGNAPMQIPNLRDPAEREKWRNDTACTDPKVAGDQLIPVWSKGTPDVPQSTYDRIRGIWEDSLKEKK